MLTIHIQKLTQMLTNDGFLELFSECSGDALPAIFLGEEILEGALMITNEPPHECTIYDYRFNTIDILKN